MKAVEALVDTLSSCGVKHIFGLPGNCLLDATDYMQKSGLIDFVTVRHEQVAAAMAEGYARVTGRPGVCVAGSGPSAANLVIGIANAYRASSPVLALTGNLPRSKMGREPYNGWDNMDVFKSITKLSLQTNFPQLLQNQIKLALLTSISGRPGPVHLDIPADVGMTDIDVPPKPNALTLEPTLVYPRGEEVRAALALIKASHRPVVIAGGGSVSSGAGPRLLELVELLGIPIVLTLASRGLISEDHPLCFGSSGVWGYAASNQLVKACDLVLALGFRFGDDTTVDWTLIPADAKIIQVDIDPLEMGKQYDLDLGILADVDTFAAELINSVKRDAQRGDVGGGGWWPKEKLKVLQDALREQRNEFFEGPVTESPLDKKVIVRGIMKLAERNAIVMCGTGVHARYVSRLRMREPRCLHKSGGYAAMGFAFPAALGAKMAMPERQVICLDGDGDFMMTVQDLETAVRLRLNVVTVVFNNGSYAAYELPRERGGRPSVEFRNPDFVKLADSFGAMAIDVTRSSDYEPALERALKSDIPVIINAVVMSESDLPLFPK